MLDIQVRWGPHGHSSGIAGILMVVVLLLVFRMSGVDCFPLPVVLLGVLFTSGSWGISSAYDNGFNGSFSSIDRHWNRLFYSVPQQDGSGDRAGKLLLRLLYTVKNTAPAVLIALVMTALGFISLFTSVVPMIQDFGKLLLIGVIMCYISSLFFGLITLYSFDWISRKNPYGLFMKKLKKSKADDSEDHGLESDSKILNILDMVLFPSLESEPGIIEKILRKITGLTLKYSTLVLIFALFTCCAGLYVDQSIPIQTDTNSFIPQDMPSLINYKNMQNILSGSGDHLNVILRVKDTSDPELLRWIDEFCRHEVENRGHVHSASSIVDLVKERNSGIIPETSEEIQAIYDEIPASQKQQYIEGGQLLHIDLDIGKRNGRP